MTDITCPESSLIKVYEERPASINAVLFDGSEASITAITVMLHNVAATLMRDVSTGEVYLASAGNVRSEPIPRGDYVVITYAPNKFPSAHSWSRLRLEQAYRLAL